MGDQGAPTPTGPLPIKDISRDSGPKVQQQSLPQQQRQQQQQQHQRIPFHAQLESVTNGVHQPYNMAALAGALPATVGYASQRMNFDPGSVYQAQHPLQYASRGAPVYFDHMTMRAAQPHQQLQHFYGPGYPPRLHTVPMQDMYQYGMNHLAHQAMNYPYGMHHSSDVPGLAGGTGAIYSRHASDPAPVPSFPRGPPRKPRQSGHALWVGNLPPAATVIDLKDHFSRDARHEIESLFLISKSNCAFVNYRSEASCLSAKSRFHDSSFHGVRLVCRLRRGSVGVTSTPTIPDMPQTPTTPVTDDSPGADPSPERNEPVIVGHIQKEETTSQADCGTAPGSTSNASPRKEPAKYFIVKSLTVEDLEASVRNGTWATQSHNEEALSEAFNQADNVFLIFSANKSGEYFGYARMASQISGDPISLGRVIESDEVGTPQSIPTPATQTAPRGRIIDDSARGTIFWEAELSDGDEEEEGPARKEAAEGEGANSGQNWGRQFKIEWMSTARLPFFRTRGLRNPWNANREVKIARDGTELEPSIGSRLVQMFHRPTGSGLPPGVV